MSQSTKPISPLRQRMIEDMTLRKFSPKTQTAYLKDEATLFIAYTGHGERVGKDFYLLPRDAQNPPDSDAAIHLTNLIMEAHRKGPGWGCWSMLVTRG